MTSAVKKLIIPGGSGFLGRVLANWFAKRGWDVVVLTRTPAADKGPARSVVWDGASLGDWAGEFEGAYAVVNMAGRSVNCRYHARNRRQMLDSRLDSTRVIGEALARCGKPPAVWLNSSTATIYKHSYDQAMDEATGIIGATSEARDAFSIEIATAWERVFKEAPKPATRKVALRTAMVLGAGGGVFKFLARLARFGLAGTLAGGQQFVSWIHEIDFCRAVEWLIDRQDFSGPVNVAAPNPVTNREMMRCLRQVVGMPIGLPATRWMLEIGTFLLRTEPELVIKSRRVVPARLLEAGFEFRFPEMQPAMQDLVQPGEGRRQESGVSHRACELPDS